MTRSGCNSGCGLPSCYILNVALDLVSRRAIPTTACMPGCVLGQGHISDHGTHSPEGRDGLTYTCPGLLGI